MSSEEKIPYDDEFDLSFKIYYEMMARRVSEILLVSSPYDAFIMEEDGRLAERIIHEYRGLNLTRPPRLTWVPSTREAFTALKKRHFDLILTMPRMDDLDPRSFGERVKRDHPDLPVILLTHGTGPPVSEAASAPPPTLSRDGAIRPADKGPIDTTYVWLGNTDLLLAIIKSQEDRMNVARDTEKARVRVIILVEDAPFYRSSLLPLLYKEVVFQTNQVMEESLNEEHKILRMRARPKILTAETYEEAWALYNRYKPYLLSVFSDVRFPMSGREDRRAGFNLLSAIRGEHPDIPLLMLSAEEENRQLAQSAQAIFINKNSLTLHMEIRDFLRDYLGFGDFIFRTPDGAEVARAANLREMEKILPSIPEESVYYHAIRNHFSSWLMARSEIQMASRLRPVKASDFEGPEQIKAFLLDRLRERRKGRQKGVITDFRAESFDPETDFLKIGKGSLGGKARGLAFMTHLFKQTPDLLEKFPDVNISVPKTVVISTVGFEDVMAINNLKEPISCACTDARIQKIFMEAAMPEWLLTDLIAYLSHVRSPIAVRSSSLLEDAQFQARAGIYSTYMLPNNHPDPQARLAQLINAVRLVWASTFSEKSRSFSQTTQHRTEEDRMGVILQQVIGRRYGDLFYPAVSGVAQSYNFYPISHMKPEEGIVHLAFGLGKTVVDGGLALRFSPHYPQILPQFATIDDMLNNSQRHFYALRLTDYPETLKSPADNALSRFSIDNPKAVRLAPLRHIASSFDPQDNRVRDAHAPGGHPLITFAGILKYKSIPLPEIITAILEMGKHGMGCPVEIEFAMNLPDADGIETTGGLGATGGFGAAGGGKGDGGDPRPEFTLLQIRPMAVSRRNMEVRIAASEIAGAVCYSESSLGHGVFTDIADIVFANPATFDPGRTTQCAEEIGRINATLAGEGRKYLLIGPGRWGTADRWLGIPVDWNDISGVGAMIETALSQLRADPSQGSHFFNNITSQGIPYITVRDDGGPGFIDWKWLGGLPVMTETRYLKHARLERPLTIKVDGKRSRAVICLDNLLFS